MRTYNVALAIMAFIGLVVVAVSVMVLVIAGAWALDIEPPLYIVDIAALVGAVVAGLVGGRLLDLYRAWDRGQ